MRNDQHATPDQPDVSNQAIRLIGQVTAALVAVLAIAAFGMSFGALRDLAIRSGVIQPSVAWLFPLIIDGGIVVFSLAALRSSLTGGDTTWFMSLVILVTCLSIGLNITHAGRGWLPGVMAAMPPLLLFLAFESLMRQIREVLGPVKVQPVKRTAKPSRISSLSVVTNEETADRKARAVQLLAQGKSRNQIAKELGVSAATVRRYLKAESAAPVVRRAS